MDWIKMRFSLEMKLRNANIEDVMAYFKSANNPLIRERMERYSDS